ncbi:MAG: PIN domain-containing protein [Acidobacteriota bacterium]
MTLFLDTAYVIALESLDDQNHHSALEHWHRLSANLPALVTTTFVFDEVVTFFNSRHQNTKAVEVGNRLLNRPSVRLVHVDQDLFLQGWQFLRQHSDKTYSLTDCISFLAMRRENIREALTFDHHFVQAGFGRLPTE